MPDEIKSRPFTLDPQRLARTTFWPLAKPRLRPFAILITAVVLAMIYAAKVSAPVALAATAIATPLAVLNAYNRYAAGFRKASNKMLFLPKTITITSEEIQQESNDGSISVVKLGNIHRVARMGEFTLVHITEEMAFFIPDGVWRSAEDESTFKQFIDACSSTSS